LSQKFDNVLPGFIDSLAENPEFLEPIPMGRYGKTEEVAELIALLASDRTAYITGQNIRIHGGITRAGGKKRWPGNSYMFPVIYRNTMALYHDEKGC
jgi:hypothetical protein